MKTQPPNFSEMAKKIKRECVITAGTEAVKFFKDSFQQGGFTDEAFQKWAPRKKTYSHKILSKTGNLEQSIHKSEEQSDENRVVIISDTDYSAIHNNGGTITKKKEDGTEIKIEIPQRQFMGQSKTLMTQISKILSDEIERAFK